MKEMILILVICIFSFTSIFAQKQLQVDENGAFRVKPDEVVNYKDTDLSVSNCASEYLKYIPTLVSMKSGDTLAVVEPVKTFDSMVSLFKYKEKIIVENGITISRTNIECTGQYTKCSEIKTAWLVILMMVSVVFMVLSNFLFNNKKFAAAFAAAAFAVAFVVAFAASVAAFAVVVVAAAVAAAAVAAALNSNSEKDYKIASIIFYIFAIIFFLVIFLV